MSGTGWNGRVISLDVISARDAGAAADVVASSEGGGGRVEGYDMVTGTCITGVSKAGVPHYYITSTVDVTSLKKLTSSQPSTEDDVIPTISDAIMMSVSRSVSKTPEVNACWGNEGVKVYEKVNVNYRNYGTGVSQVIEDVGRMGLGDISKATRLVESSEGEGGGGGGEINPSTASSSASAIGGTITIVDMSKFDRLNSSSFAIPRNTCSLISISSPYPRLSMSPSNTLVEKTYVNVTGTFDHRVVDGAVGARFLDGVKGRVEQPFRMIM